MHGLWGMGQMMFTKYIIVVDDDVNVHNTSEGFRRPWPSLINMDESVKARAAKILNL